MVEPKQSGQLEIRLPERSVELTRSSSVAAQRTIAAVERAVAGAVARLLSDPDDRLLVAVSGGPDSVAALHALQRIRGSSGFQLSAAHLNHGLRGPESDRDERFVLELCRRLDIELIIERTEALHPPNLEERARELRYEFLNRTADTLKARFIVLGHHRDDQAETVLLRLLRGTGIAGLAAMAAFGPGRLMRPLLTLGRTAILAYLAAIGADYVLDSSNLEDGALRNRVRGVLLPQLARDYSPGIARRLAELASEMREVDSFIEAEARRALDGRLVPMADQNGVPSYRVDVRGFASINPALARAILRELIRRGIGDLRGIERVHIKAMCRLADGGNPSATVALPRNWRFRREYDSAVLEYHTTRTETAVASAADRCAVSLMPGANLLSASGVTLTLREIAANEPRFPTTPWHPPSRFEAYFDAAAVPRLAARCVRAGDRIQPLGLRGSRKIQDVFVDCKVTVAKRRWWPLVVSGDAVLWIPGLVRSRIALVTSASRKVLHLRADSLPSNTNVRLPGL